MKKALINKIEEYVKKSCFPYSVYFSTTGTDRRYKGYKYFFKYNTTHTVVNAFKTLNELEKFLG